MNRELKEVLIQYILDHQDRFYRLAYSYTKNQEDALDAVQNAVCKALEAYIDHFKPSKAGFSISDGGTSSINFGVVNGVLAISGINYSN